MGKDNSFLLRAHCATYNHVHYITDTLNGFVMQETDFPFVCTIMDDASTDGEQEVIKNYMQEHFDLQDSSVAYEKDTDYGHVTFARHKTNKNCYFAVNLLKENHYSQKKSKAPYLMEWMDTKYIALCEGDDYWTDPLKLQKQVDALEMHPQCTIAYCRVQAVDNEKNGISNFIIPPESELESGVVSLSDFCRVEWGHCKWCFHTSSFMFRTECHSPSSKRDEFFSKFPYGDMPTQLWCLLQGEGYFIGDFGGCYRWLSGGYNSRVLKDKSFRIAQERKLVDALYYFDGYTKKKYHKDISNKIRYSLISIYSEKPSALFAPKNWKHICAIGLRKTMGVVIKGISPGCFNVVRKLVK